MVKLEPPELVKVADCLAVPPTVTLPKSSKFDPAVRVPGVVALPDRGIFNSGFDPLLVMATLPVAVPAVLGE